MNESFADEIFIMSLKNELITIGIPPRPIVLNKIECEMRKEDPNYLAIERLISKDVGIAASLLKMARSPLFGNASGNVRTIHDAILKLGLNIVSSAVAGLSIRKTFADVPNLERFWRDSSFVAEIAAWLVSQNIVPGSFIKRDEVYTFGLFRDVGVPVFLSNFKDYLETLNLATNEVGASLTLIEDREYGVNHAFLGAQLAKEWALPNEYWQAIEFHHDIPALCGMCQVPLADISRYFIAIVQLAEFLHKTVSHKGNTSDWDQFGESCLDQLQITSDGLNKLFEKMTSYKQR